MVEKYHHILIVGMGKTGFSIAQYLNRKNIKFSVYDNEKSIDELKILLDSNSAISYFTGPLDQKYFTGIDCIAISPGVDLRNTILKKIQKNNIPIINDLTLFSSEIDQKKTKIIAVTGTNGKTTVCTLLEYLFLEAGYKAKAAGNIGFPILDIEELNSLDVLILELSSFQLEIKHPIIFDIGMILNITEDHMDRYDSFEEYASVKRKILNQSKNKVIWIDDKTMREWKIEDAIFFSTKIKNNKKSYGIKIDNKNIFIVNNTDLKIDITNTNLMGKHNQLNFMAAIAAFREIDNKFEDFSGALQKFPVINNRLEWIKEIDGINFYNDSKATNVASAIAAIESFVEKRIFLIAGGDSKNQNLTSFSEVVNDKVQSLYLIGKDAQLIGSACKRIKGRKEIFSTLKEAVISAFKDAKNGDIILLAPACASYDMYKNYIERGNDFKSIIFNLSV